MGKHLDVPRRARARDLYRDGWAPEAIADLLDTTLGRVRAVLRDSGIIVTQTHLLTDYEPPDPDEDGLSPLQRAEREQSLAAAFRLKANIEMTEGIARRIMHASDMELRDELGIGPAEIKAVREIARAWRERLLDAKAGKGGE